VAGRAEDPARGAESGRQLPALAVSSVGAPVLAGSAALVGRPLEAVAFVLGGVRHTGVRDRLDDGADGALEPRPRDDEFAGAPRERPVGLLQRAGANEELPAADVEVRRPHLELEFEPAA